MIIDAYTHMFHSTYTERLAEIGGTWVTKKVTEARDLIQRKPQLIDVEQRLTASRRLLLPAPSNPPPYVLAYSPHLESDISHPNRIPIHVHSDLT